MKRCTKCKIEKPKSEFYHQKCKPDGFASHCKVCKAAYAREYIQRPGRKECLKKYRQTDKCKAQQKLYWNTEGGRLRRKHYKMMTNFGISVDQYLAMDAQQGSRCAICSRHRSEFVRNLAVDHCHTTGKVRGLLCDGCNKSLGLMRENCEAFASAISYLKRHGGK